MVKRTKVRGPEKAVPVIDIAPLSAPLFAKTGKTGGAPMGGGQAYF